MLVLPALGLAAGGCSSIGGGASAQDSGQAGAASSFADGVTKTLFGPPAETQAVAGPDDEPNCPVVDVRSGASTITVHGPGDPIATNVRYQATIGELARECAFPGANMTMKVGVQGRIILGPVGQPGRVDVPLRIALVREGPEPKTVWTKLYKVPVTIPPNQTNVSFVHVEQDLTVPKPSPADAENYIVYVGFDQVGLKEHGPRQRAPRNAR